MIEEMNEQIKKLQDVLIEYAKSDDSAHIVQQQDDPNNQIILKNAAKQVNQLSENQITVKNRESLRNQMIRNQRSELVKRFSPKLMLKRSS